MPEQQWSIEQWLDIKHDFVGPVKESFMKSIRYDIENRPRYLQLTYSYIRDNPDSGSGVTELLRGIYSILKNNLGRRPSGSAGRETSSGEAPRSSTTRRRRRSIIGGSKRRMTRKQTTG